VLERPGHKTGGEHGPRTSKRRMLPLGETVAYRDVPMLRALLAYEVTSPTSCASARRAASKSAWAEFVRRPMGGR